MPLYRTKRVHWTIRVTGRLSLNSGCWRNCFVWLKYDHLRAHDNGRHSCRARISVLRFVSFLQIFECDPWRDKSSRDLMRRNGSSKEANALDMRAFGVMLEDLADSWAKCYEHVVQRSGLQLGRHRFKHRTHSKSWLTSSSNVLLYINNILPGFDIWLWLWRSIRYIRCQGSQDVGFQQTIVRNLPQITLELSPWSTWPSSPHGAMMIWNPELILHCHDTDQCRRFGELRKYFADHPAANKASTHELHLSKTICKLADCIQ